MRQLQFAVIAGAAYKTVVHKLNAGRVQSRFNQVRYNADGFVKLGKDSEDIQFIRAQRQKFKSGLGNDAQSTFTAHYKLFQAVAGAVLFKGGAKRYNIAGRGNNFNRVNLIACSAVTHSLVAACVGCNIAAD